MRAFRLALQIARDNRGNAESTLVLIPLLILFLIGMQISLATHSRNVERMQVQDEASIRAISGDFQDGDNFIHIESSGDSQNLDLLITHRTREIHDLLPGLLSGTSSGREVSVGGIAIVENSR
jgi:hypothetical protein